LTEAELDHVAIEEREAFLPLFAIMLIVLMGAAGTS